MVEVFRTSIDSEKHADFILKKLNKAFPDDEINFDLENCDHILRMETKDAKIDAKSVIELVTNYGFLIEVLPDIPVTKRVLIE